MKKLIVACVVLLLVGVSLFVYLYKGHPVVLKVAAGSARVLSPPLNTTIKVDGRELPAAKCFAMRTLFDGSPADSLVLWLPDSSTTYGRHVLIVSRMHRDVGLPNSSNLDYYLLWDKFLFQSESGSLYASFSGPKFDGQDPQLEIGGTYIKFVVPDSPVLAGKKIEVIFAPAGAA